MNSNQHLNRYDHLTEFFDSKNVLVTGGFGFVGGHVTKRLVELGANVTVIDINTDVNRDSILNCASMDLRSKILVQEADVVDANAMKEIIQEGRFHFIYHFAAYASVIEKAISAPYDTIMANTMGWVNVLEACRLAPYKPNMIFLSSTDKVYGEMEEDSYSEHSTPLRGIGVYDSAKLAADVFSRTYHEAFGLPTVTLRMCNIYGPYDFNMGYRLLPKAMASIFGSAEPEAPELYFDAIEHHRDYLYVQDLVTAILLLTQQQKCRGDVYNLAAGTYMPTPQMLKTIVEQAAEVEKTFDAERAETIMNNGISIRVRQSGSTVHAITKQHLNGKKIEEATGFTVQSDFMDTLRETIQFYRSYMQTRAEGC